MLVILCHWLLVISLSIFVLHDNISAAESILTELLSMSVYVHVSLYPMTDR